MPLYDFHCDKCNHDLELFLGMNDKRPTICPNCNQEGLHRVFTPIVIAVDSKQPKTIGELADKNTERMVKEGKLNKKALDYHDNQKKRKEYNKRMRKIQSMSNKEKTKYIRTGEI